MKKKKSLFIVCLVLALLCTVHCTDEDLFAPSVQTTLQGFSLEEAQTFFREQAEKYATRGYSLDDESRQTLSPGDFVPEWDEATASVQGELACYNVPIVPTYHFKAVSVEERGTAMLASKVNVYQKLVIVKELSTGRMSQYILTLVPTPSYDARNGSSTAGNFVNCGGKQGYSGLAVYTCVYTPFTARVSRYEDGKRVQGVFLLAPETRSDQSDTAVDLARALTASVIVRRGKIATTRFEDDYGWDWDINGGELPEVVVTPDYDWDQWLDDTRPDGNVDPEPEEDYPEDPAEDQYLGGDTYDSEEQEIDVEKAVEKAKVELQKMGVNLSNINIKIITKTEGNSVTNARRYADGTIEIYPRFGKWENVKTQTAILWHEIYHLRNDRPISTDKSIQIEPPIKIEPPDDIKAIIEERIIKQTGFSKGSSGFDYAYQDDITFKSVSPIYADNEYNSYIAEKEIFPDNLLDKEYVDERNYNIWYYGTELQVLKEHQNR